MACDAIASWRPEQFLLSSALDSSHHSRHSVVLLREDLTCAQWCIAVARLLHFPRVRIRIPKAKRAHLAKDGAMLSKHPCPVRTILEVFRAAQTCRRLLTLRPRMVVSPDIAKSPRWRDVYADEQARRHVLFPDNASLLAHLLRTHGSQGPEHIASTYCTQQAELRPLDGDLVHRREWMHSALFPGFVGIGGYPRWLINDARH